MRPGVGARQEDSSQFGGSFFASPVPFATLFHGNDRTVSEAGWIGNKLIHEGVRELRDCRYAYGEFARKGMRE
jgi:hypothetical protein